MDPSERRTSKKLRDTNSWHGDDFGHSWHFRRGRLGPIGREGKDHTDRMRRLNDAAIVRAELNAVEEDHHLDVLEVQKAHEEARFDSFTDDQDLFTANLLERESEDYLECDAFDDFWDYDY